MLSGGGARGIAHVGVLKVLEDMHVPVDAIAGTSMGAVVGGLYASGLSAREIEKIMTSLNWQDAFRDRPPREDLTLRRKQEDQSFLVKFPLGVRGGRILLPKGLIEGQSLNELLRRLTLPVVRITSFDDLPTRFRAVATDLESGEPVVLDSGDLTSAMRASMSAPGIFAPVEREGRLLVDGGIADNVPVDIARRMGVDVLIVVDVAAPLLGRDKLDDVSSISNQMLAILIRRNGEQQLATLGPKDVLIAPPLGDASSFDFGAVGRVIGAGEAAARADAPALRQLAVSDEEMQRYEARRDELRRPPPVIRFVQAESGSQQYSDAVGKQFADMTGKPLDPDAIARRVSALYGQGGLDTLDYRVVGEESNYGLSIDARPSSMGPNYLRFGLSLQDDFQGNATYNAAMRFVMSDITRNAGEWVTDVQGGTTSLVSTELFLPLAQFSGWFVMPHISDEARDLFIVQGETQNLEAEYRIHTFDYGSDFGYQFSNWGELRTGVQREQGHYLLEIGDPSDPSLPVPDHTPFDLQDYFVRFTYDQLDDVNFPHSGQQATAAVERQPRCGRRCPDFRPGDRQLPRCLLVRAQHAVVLRRGRHDAAVAHHRHQPAVPARGLSQPLGPARGLASRPRFRHRARALLPADRPRRPRLLRRAHISGDVARDGQRLAEPQRGELRQHAEGCQRVPRPRYASRPALYRYRLRPARQRGVLPVPRTDVLTKGTGMCPAAAGGGRRAKATPFARRREGRDRDVAPRAN